MDTGQRDVYADLDGEPFVAYYCADCAEVYLLRPRGERKGLDKIMESMGSFGTGTVSVAWWQGFNDRMAGEPHNCPYTVERYRYAYDRGYRLGAGYGKA
jgi:hypothetical protein